MFGGRVRLNASSGLALGVLIAVIPVQFPVTKLRRAVPKRATVGGTVFVAFAGFGTRGDVGTDALAAPAVAFVVILAIVVH